MKKLLAGLILIIVGAVVSGILVDRLLLRPPQENDVAVNGDEGKIKIEFSTLLSLAEEGAVPTVITRDNIYDYYRLADLKKYLYAIESDTFVTEEDLDVFSLMAYDAAISVDTEGPKVLVFHTHSQEYYLDSSPVREDSVVGIGDELCRILEEKYGIPTLHDSGEYDVVDGEVVISGAYERMTGPVEALLREYPSIEVCIDLHRDITPGNDRLVWEYKGKDAAKIMFFNGMSRTYSDGVVTQLDTLPNPYLQENLAFSLQMKLCANEKYPEFTRKNYIRAYRYSLHMREKSLLIEFGTDQNTVAEAYQAVEPLAALLAEILLP